MPPSLTTPADRLNKLADHYDLVVIGGGIHGAAVLWEAASRGLRAILLEQTDFAAGTSANSLKVVHGGLRNLQRLDFAGMRHYIGARRALLRIAPNLVRPMLIHLPTYAKPDQSRPTMALALRMYDLVGWDRNAGLPPERRLPLSHTVSAAELRRRIPGYQDPDVTGAACWYDAHVQNAERLVLAFVMSAVRAGADALNYVEAESIEGHQGRVRTVRATDRLSGTPFELQCEAVIDCRGPWASEGLSEAFKKQPVWTSWAKAINLVIRREIAPQALGFKPAAASGALNRFLFTVPWRGRNILGTWYYPGNPHGDGHGLTEAELTACLAQVNSRFPAANLVPEDVSLVHWGWLPAQATGSKDAEPPLLPKARILARDRHGGLAGSFAVIGVKLTNAREVAVQAVQQVLAYLGRTAATSKTHTTNLYSAKFDEWAGFERHWQQALGEHHAPKIITRLITNYGSNLSDIMAMVQAQPELGDCVPGTDDVLKAEVDHVLFNEMTHTLSDLILRRTDMGTLERPKDETIAYCADRMSQYWGWGQDTRDEQVYALLRHYPAWR